MCQEMGWDYYTYEKQPHHFLQEIALIMNYESQISKNKSELTKLKPKGLRRA